MVHLYRKKIPNSMSNQDFIFDDIGYPFLNIHKLWCYSQASMVERLDTQEKMVIHLLTIARMKIT